MSLFLFFVVAVAFGAIVSRVIAKDELAAAKAEVLRLKNTLHERFDLSKRMRESFESYTQELEKKNSALTHELMSYRVDTMKAVSTKGKAKSKKIEVK